MYMLLRTSLFLMLVPAIGLAADDFTKLDASKDGQVTLEELTAAGIGWNQDQITAADTDNSGTLSKAEYESAAAKY